MYGNYCGPYWSNGKWQASVEPQLEAVDELDETCRDHDAVYARRGDLLAADNLFVRRNFGNGFLPTMMSIPVGVQAFLRANDYLTSTTHDNTQSQNMTKQTPRLRGASKKQSPTTIKRSGASPALEKMQMVTPPTSFGVSMQASKPRIIRTSMGTTVTGRDFIGTVEANGVATFGLGKSALLSPAYFASTTLGNISRSYERYRWRRLRIHYVPKVSTSLAGQVVLTSQKSVSEPSLQPEASDFLPRAMSQGNADFSPLWLPSHIDIDCDTEWNIVDPATTTDPDDSIHEELLVYTQSATSGQVGYLFAEYSCEFKEPIYQPHSTQLPIVTGPGLRITFQDFNIANNALDDWNLALATAGTLPQSFGGSIYRAVLDIQGSTPAAPGTFNSMVQMIQQTWSTSTTISNQSISFPLVGGTTLYLVQTVANPLFTVFTSLEAAISGQANGQLFHSGLVSTARGTYVFDIALIRYGPTLLPKVQ